MMDTSASNRRLRTLLVAIGNDTLIPQPDFQRRLVWTNKDKIEFIITVLEGYPFPEVYIAAGKVDRSPPCTSPSLPAAGWTEQSTCKEHPRDNTRILELNVFIRQCKKYPQDDTRI